VAYLIKSDGTITEIKPQNGTAFTLPELQGFVGGYIEIIYKVKKLVIGAFNAKQRDLVVAKGSIMVVNEDGKSQGLPRNMIATLLYRHGGWDAVVGDVVVGSQTELGG
jgi:hypothetical protein